MLLLKNVPLLAGIPTDQLVIVADIAEERRFDGGETVFEQGTPGEHLYLIVRGRAAVVMGSEAGEEVELARLGEGEVFGELALLDDAPRSATIRALEPLECLVLSREDFRDLLDVSPALARSVIRVLTHRIRATLQT